MSMVNRLMRSLQTAQPMSKVDYRLQMQLTVEKVRTAELQMAQATTLEELDLGRVALQQAQAELQHLIRLAKRERGIPLRDIGENESLFRRILCNLKRRPALAEGEAHI